MLQNLQLLCIQLKVKSVAQTKANTLETVVLGKTSDIKPADIKITNTANNNAIAVKSVSVDKADATKVTVETLSLIHI